MFKRILLLALLAFAPLMMQARPAAALVAAPATLAPAGVIAEAQYVYRRGPRGRVYRPRYAPRAYGYRRGYAPRRYYAPRPYYRPYRPLPYGARPLYAPRPFYPY